MTTCRLCEHDLTVELDADSFDEGTSSSVGQSITAPDDLLLHCGCHFHYHCLLEESSGVALSLACPACNNAISTAPSQGSTNPQILTRYINEGGLQPNLDIFPLIQEEAYLETNPSARPARAFMTLCSEGDVSGVVEILQAIGEDPDEDDMEPAELLRWNDPLDGGKTALHVAVEKGQVEVVLLLLWLGSRANESAFPQEFLDAVRRMNVPRSLVGEGEDIRALKGEDTRSAVDVAREMGSTWAGLSAAGLFDI